MKVTNNYNYIIGPTDTDSISFCKEDLSPFSEEERNHLLRELNDISPDMIVWEDDGYYKACIIVRAKNYVLQYFDGTLTIKGNSLKAPMKEPALREFIKEILNELLNESNNYIPIYNKYVKEILNVEDMSRWSSKKTITPSVLNPKRSNEQNIKNAIEGTEYVEGDKIRLFFKNDETLCLLEKFDGDYNIDRLLKKLYATAEIFDKIINVDQIWPNYALKRNKKLLEELK